MKKIFSILALALAAMTASAATTYQLTVGQNEHGTVIFKVDGEEVTSAKENDVVTVEITPASGWSTAQATGQWSAAVANSPRHAQSIDLLDKIDMTRAAGNKWTFTMMRANAEISVEYNKLLTNPDISITVGDIKPMTYTGQELTPAVTVKDGTKILTEGTDYTLQYADNVEVGTATVTATGIGKYDGTLTAHFTIVLPVDEEIFPNQNLRSYVQSITGASASRPLTEADLEDVTHLYLMAMDIDDLSSVRFFKSLVYLNCRNNHLTELDLSGNPRLRELHIEDNAIRGDAMTALVASLPTVADGSGILKALDLSLPYTPGALLRAPLNDKVVERNEMTTVQVAAAKAKGWKVEALQSDGTWADYPGSEATAIEAIESAVDGQQPAAASWYTLDGRRLTEKPSQAGVYIQNGKKAVVK